MNMRVTIRLPDDLHERIAVDALRKRQNSKEAVIAEILRAHYGGGDRDEVQRAALGWRIAARVHGRIAGLRRRAKAWR